MSGLNCLERALLARAEAPSGTPLYCAVNPTEGQGTARFFAVSSHPERERNSPFPGALDFYWRASESASLWYTGFALRSSPWKAGGQSKP